MAAMFGRKSARGVGAALAAVLFLAAPASALGQEDGGGAGIYDPGAGSGDAAKRQTEQVRDYAEEADLSGASDAKIADGFFPRPVAADRATITPLQAVAASGPTSRAVGDQQPLGWILAATVSALLTALLSFRQLRLSSGRSTKERS